MSKQSILVICTGNSCRSQMAEGFFNKYIAEQNISVKVFSAGIEAHGLNKYAVQVMKEVGVLIDNQVSELVEKYVGNKFSYVITVCDSANERCPYFQGNTIRIHRTFQDPANATGSEEDILAVYRKVRDEIADFCLKFVTEKLV